MTQIRISVSTFLSIESDIPLKSLDVSGMVEKLQQH